MTTGGSKRDYSQLMKDALLELKQLRASLDDLKRAQTEPIAIVGMSCRFPGGCSSAAEFWELLRVGVDAIGQIPEDRWDAASYYDADPDVPGKMATRFGGFIDRIDQFDPAFFGISPREARSLDPQQRLLLEVTWEALEVAGQSPTQLYGSATGVFVGMSTFDYALHQVGGAVSREDLEGIDGYVATGTTMSPAAGRLSYVLGLNGPSMVVDTACSSSLVATHLAVTSLRNRECNMAIVGGVNLILRPEWNVNFTKAHMLAPDGRCKTFDAAADGYTRGEGCGVVVLQRLSEALAARRNIFAIIRGSAINQDGASGGLTVPSGPSQEQVIHRALESAGVRPEDVSYVEAHGTGTSLGDPIEVAALGAVFGGGRRKSVPLRVGSVKTNIGHLEAAAGVAGLMKVALALRNQEIPPHLHFRTGNPMIDWDRLPIAVPVTRTPWTRGDGPRRAGLSSFGFTGTNAHIVLEEAPRVVPAADSTIATSIPERPLHLVTLSARTPAALQQLAGRYAKFLGEGPELPLADIAFTANTGRAHFRHRLATVADSVPTAARALDGYAGSAQTAGVLTGAGTERPKLVFLFTGQGAQQVGMARALYETQPQFRAALDRCDEILRAHLQRPLLEVLYPQPGESSPLDDTAYTQPALFAIEYALAAMWRSWGIEPDAVMGHSIGEYVAACVAGVFSLEDGLRLVAERGRLMQALSHAGQMVAAQTNEERAAAALASSTAEASLAAINGPNSVVISGAAGTVSAVAASLAADGIRTQALRVSHAFHSPLMEPMLVDFERIARTVAFSAPNREIISNVTGRLARAELTTADYWVKHVRQPVRFAEGMRTLDSHGYKVFVEVGPGSTLLGLGRMCVPDAEAAWLPSIRAGHEWQQLLATLAGLYARGASVDWSEFDRGYPRRPVELPTYPFQRQRYWVDRAARRPVKSPPPPGDVESSPSTVERPFESDCLYDVEWRERPRLAEQVPLSADGRWIVLSDRETGPALAARLQERGGRVTLVSAGESYERLGEEHFTVNPLSADDLERVWTAMGEPIRGVVHLWGLDAPGTEGLKEPKPTTAEVLESALHAVRLVAARPKKGVQPLFWCVTRGAVPATSGPGGDSPLALAQAPLWAFGRVVSLEHPDLWGGMVDLELGPVADAHANAEALLCELLGSDGEDQIAVRRDRRYVPRVVRRVPLAGSPITLDQRRTYLVAGGTGALGLHAACWLASRGARSIVLAGRRGADAPGAAAAVEMLRSMGVTRATIAKTDFSSEPDVDRLLAEIAASDAPLAGVVHAAGVDARVPLVNMTAEDLASMLPVKVAGAWMLHEKTRDLDLKLFVLFSSVSSIWGAHGRAHYAAANGFLDALAHERRRIGLPALAVNWGPWRGGGMATEEDLSQLERSGNRGLEPEIAVRALDALLAGDAVSAVVADVDWPRFRTFYEARRARPLLAAIESRPTSQPKPMAGRGDWIARLGTLTAAERPAVLESLLRAEVAETLGYGDPEDVPIDQSVFALGMDSLRAVELAVRLQQHLGLEQSIHFFDSPEVSTLAARLLQGLVLTDAAETMNAGEKSLEGPTPADAGFTRHGEDGLVRYTPGDEPEIFAFSRVAWPARPEDSVESRWRWMFLDSARRLGVEPKVWLYRDGGKVVAHHGAIPVSLNVRSEKIESAWFVDTMVLESHRSHATGARLIIDSNDEFPVGLSLGQTLQMRSIALRMGWEQVAPLQTFVLLLQPRRVLTEKLHPLVASMAGIGLTSRHYLKRALAGPRDERLQVRPVERFAERHDELWERVKVEYPCAVARDASYLNWKYVQQPGQDFVRLEFLTEGRLSAMAVLALDDAGDTYKYGRAFIVELVVSAADAKLVIAVLDGIRDRAASSGADALVFHVVCEKLEKTIRAYGFMQRKPTRYLLVNPNRTSSELRRELLTARNWLITMGDSDIDRPWEAMKGRLQKRPTTV